MKIAIYLGPLKGKEVDASRITDGNPGVGGTQYCMLELAHYLNTSTVYEVYIFASRTYIVEKGIRFIKIDGDSDVCEAVDAEKSDIFILSQFSNIVLENDIAQRIKAKVIIWCHNYIYSNFCDFISKTQAVKACVFVGKQQYDRYIDDDVIKKSIYIYNMYTCVDKDVERLNDSKTVVYMGALINGKGFAELCSIWPAIIKDVPDAKLLVLGSGSLYGDAQLGEYGLASAEYENQFIKYITDSEGKIIDSVRFLGIVGNEKNGIFQKASVGVVNPSGRTETFGMGIVEMADAKLPVVTIGKNGYFDTIDNYTTGILSKSLHKMSEDIVFLLKNPDINEKYGCAAKMKVYQYDPMLIGKQWEDILKCVYYDNYRWKPQKASRPYSNNHKWVRMFNRVLRFGLKLSFIPSLIKVESFVARILR